MDHASIAAVMVQTQELQAFTRRLHETALLATECADHCIEGDTPLMAECAKACLDVTAIATTCAGLLARRAKYARQMVQVCAQAAEECARLCRSHDDEHAAVARCADACEETARLAEACSMEQ